QLNKCLASASVIAGPTISTPLVVERVITKRGFFDDRLIKERSSAGIIGSRKMVISAQQTGQSRNPCLRIRSLEMEQLIISRFAAGLLDGRAQLCQSPPLIVCSYGSPVDIKEEC